MGLLHVLLHVGLIVKLLIADSAEKRLLPGVGVQMPRQLILGEIRLGADVTYIFTFLRGQLDLSDPYTMHLGHVDLHDTFIFVFLPALGTLEVPDV